VSYVLRVSERAHLMMMALLFGPAGVR